MSAEISQKLPPPGPSSADPATRLGQRWYNWPARLMSWAGMTAVAAMLVHVAAEVLSRSAFNAPLTGTLEIITYWYLAGITFIGMWQAFISNEHISVDLITARLQPGTQWILYIFGATVTLIFLGLVFWFSLNEAIEAFGKAEFIGADRVPIWTMRFIVPLGMGTYMLGLILQSISVIRDGHLNSLEEHHDAV